MLEETRPSRRLDRYQPVNPALASRRKRKPVFRWLILIGLLAYFFAPFRTNILLLGSDDSPERGALGRTDTIILTTVVPTKPYVGMLSIPRDLWVNVPNVGEQRINTAYFFAESNQRGAGPEAAMQTVRQNFGMHVDYYAVIHMLGLVNAVNAVGGVDVRLPSAMGEYAAGAYHLNGDEALAFIRERSSSDDFNRMRRTQLLLVSLGTKVLQPANWQSLPKFILAGVQTVDTNIPLWQMPRLVFAVVRIPFFGVDARTISSEMVYPFVTSGGAQVLAPNWELINPVLMEMFGE
jgi:LCP family protein required for cell wall assembly